MWITLTHARQAGWLFNSLRSHVSQVLTGKFPNYSLHFSATLVASCGHVICAGFSEDVMLVSSEPRLLERECFAWMLSLWFHWPLAGQCVEYCFPASIIISFDYLAKPLGRVICFVCVSTLCVCVCVLDCVRLFASHELQPARLLCPWDSPGKIMKWVAVFPTPWDLPNPGVWTVPPASFVLAGRFFTTEPPGKGYPTLIQMT